MGKRRGQNEGSIYKRSDGRWVGVISLGYKNSKRHRKSFYGETRREVQENLTAALRSHQQGLPPPPERQTVGQFLDRWLKDTVKPTVRPLTSERYGQLVRLHIKPSLGRIPLVKLGPQDVQTLLNEKSGEGLAPRTVKHIHVVLRCALAQALKWGLVPRNVAKLVDSPRVEDQEVEPFTPEEARTFLTSITGHRLEALYVVALCVGLRKGEILGLRWQDIDLDTGTLSVRVALQRINGKLVLVEPKTKKSRRTLDLPKSVVTALRAYRARQLRERLLAGKRWQDSGLVFTTRFGTPLNPRNVNRHFEGVLDRAGLPRKRFHDLRHTCASLLLGQDVHPRVVMEVLGHSQISLTMDTYSHVMPSLKREAADRMDTALAQKS